MDEQNKPNARKKRVVGAGKGIEKQGEGLGTGPVGQSSQRPPQNAFSQQAQQNARPIQQSAPQSTQRPAQNPFTQNGYRHNCQNEVNPKILTSAWLRGTLRFRVH